MNLMLCRRKDGTGETGTGRARVTVLSRIKNLIVPCSSRFCLRETDNYDQSGSGRYLEQIERRDVEDRTKKKKNFEKESIWKRLSPKTHRVQLAVKKAVSVDLILKTIFEQAILSSKDLLRCRLVCWNWNRISTQALIDRRLCELHIGNELFFRRPAFSFADLLRTIQKSALIFGFAGLPITSISFGKGTWGLKGRNAPMNRQIGKFLQIHETHCKITSLRLDCGDRARSSDTFLELFNHLPSIEHLDIESVSIEDARYWNWLEAHPSLAQLKSIKIKCRTLVMDDGNNDFVLAILRAAVNLQRIDDFNVKFMTDVVVAAHKCHAIKELYFRNENGNKNALYTKLANENLELTALRVVTGIIFSEEIPAEAVLSLNKILESSKNSMRRLIVHATFGIHGVRLPVLKNLAYLRYRQVYLQPAMFPQGIELAAYFPNLKTVNLELENLYKKSVKAFFPRDDFRGRKVNALPSVRELKINCGLDLHGFRAIALLFPNLTSLRLTNTLNKLQANPWVWSLPTSLEWLEIHGMVLERNVSFDSFFTGIAAKDCKKLKDLKLKPSEEVEFVKCLTRKPALQDLRNLKKLKVCFDHRHNLKWKKLPEKDKVHSVISHLSGWYGFKSIPNLEVMIGYNHSSSNAKDLAAALEPFRSFVQLVHEPFKGRPRR